MIVFLSARVAGSRGLFRQVRAPGHALGRGLL